ncbi:MAG TPA: hypothetical protein VGB13_01330 [Candidatus Krumholzibacteria bacterium]|jgi:uncharacterized membrane protein
MDDIESARIDDDAADGPETKRPGDEPAARERWLSAICYVGPGWIFPVFRREGGAFLGWHVRQGFALFFLEAIVVALLIIIDETLAKMPLLGWLFLVLSVLLQLGAFVGALTLSVLGFVKALAGEEFRIPVLDEYAEKIPLGD